MQDQAPLKLAAGRITEQPKNQTFPNFLERCGKESYRARYVVLGWAFFIDRGEQHHETHASLPCFVTVATLAP